jgi:hypothetical protein
MEKLYSFIDTVEDFDLVFRDSGSLFNRMCKMLGLDHPDDENILTALGARSIHGPFDALVNHDPAIVPHPHNNRLFNCIKTVDDLCFALRALHVRQHIMFIDLFPEQRLKNLIRTKESLFKILDLLDANELSKNALSPFINKLGKDKFKQLFPTEAEFKACSSKYPYLENMIELQYEETEQQIKRIRLT